MNENKWAKVSSIMSLINEAQARQQELIEILVKTLTDEDKDNESTMETDKALLERLQHALQ